jgi:hypothetical protein
VINLASQNHIYTIECHNALIEVEKVILLKIPYFRALFNPEFKKPEKILKLNLFTCKPATILKVIDFLKGSEVQFNEYDYETLNILNVDITNKKQEEKRKVELLNVFMSFIHLHSPNNTKLLNYQNYCIQYYKQNIKELIEKNEIIQHDVVENHYYCELIEPLNIKINPKEDFITNIKFYIYTENIKWKKNGYINLIKSIEIYYENKKLNTFDGNLIRFNYYKNPNTFIFEDNYMILSIPLFDIFPLNCKAFNQLNFRINFNNIKDFLIEDQNEYKTIDLNFAYTEGYYRFPNNHKIHNSLAILQTLYGEPQKISFNKHLGFLCSTCFDIVEIIIEIKQGTYRDITDITIVNSDFKELYRFNEIALLFERKKYNLPDNIIIIEPKYQYNTLIHFPFIYISLINEIEIEKVYINSYNVIRFHENNYYNAISY